MPVTTPQNLRSSLALRLSRPSPLLLLAAALVALAVFFVLGSPPAAAQDPTPIPLSKNANLSGLTASYANGNSGTFTDGGLDPGLQQRNHELLPGFRAVPVGAPCARLRHPRQGDAHGG